MPSTSATFNQITATIAINTAASTVIDIRGYAQMGFQIPSAFTGASVSFQVSADNSTFVALHDTSNAAVSQTVTASKAYTLPISIFPWGYMKIISASNEAAARSIIVALKY